MDANKPEWLVMSYRNPRKFRGHFEIKLDNKGRLSLPSSYLQSFEKHGRLVLTNSLFQNLKCLQGYSWEEWLSLEKQIDALPPLDPAVQAFNRFYLAAAQDLELDAQNRLVIPASLRRFASLGQSITLVGLGEKFEIWDTVTWQSVFEHLTTGFEPTQLQVATLIQGERE